MRHYLIILMIALLPLRSWAGDVMAVSMATQALTTANAELVVKHVATDMQDCAGHSGSANDLPEAAASDEGHCKTCVTCQICHSVALVSIDVLASDPPDVNRLKSTSASTFASATLADSVKPPIS